MWRCARLANTGPVRIPKWGSLRLVARLVSLRPALVVLEATGGLEISLTGACATAGLPVVVVESSASP